MAALAAATAGLTTWQALTGETEVAADGTLVVAAGVRLATQSLALRSGQRRGVAQPG